MADRDSIHRFLFEDFPVRGEIVHLDATWQAVLERFDYPPHIRNDPGRTHGGDRAAGLNTEV